MSVRDDRAALGVAGETFGSVCWPRSRASNSRMGIWRWLVPLEPGVVREQDLRSSIP